MATIKVKVNAIQNDSGSSSGKTKFDSESITFKMVIQTAIEIGIE